MHKEQCKQEQRKNTHKQMTFSTESEEKNILVPSQFMHFFIFLNLLLLRAVATVRQNEYTNSGNGNKNPSTSSAVYFVRMGCTFCRISVVDDAFAAINDAHITMRVYDSRNFVAVSFALHT